MSERSTDTISRVEFADSPIIECIFVEGNGWCFWCSHSKINEQFINGI